MMTLLWMLAVGCTPTEGDDPLLDADGDGFRATDCDDTRDDVHPGAEEVCDGADNDCDGEVDEDVAGATLRYLDADGDGYGDSLTSQTFCDEPGEEWIADDRDCDDSDPDINPDGVEACDDVDNDCDGLIDDADESLASGAWTFDADLDGYGGDAQPPRCSYVEGYVFDGGDCDDLDPSINPGIDEVCDGIDNDCDDLVDDEDDSAIDAASWYPDLDGDRYGDEAAGVFSCEPIDGYLLVAGDCDDTDPTIHDDAPELVGDGIDSNCNGLIDEGALSSAAAIATGSGEAALGAAVAGGADINGDGAPDIAIGAPGADANAAYLFFGGDLSGALDPAAADVILTGESDADAAGAALALGDIDGDGYGDVVVSAIGDAGGAGTVYVLYGPLSGTLPVEAADIRLSGGAGDAAGERLALGDLDGDSVLDLLVGSPQQDAAQGKVTLLWGDQLEDGALATVQDAGFLGFGAETWTGQAVSASGDLNGDGRDDLLIGSPLVDSGGVNSGAVYLFYGQGFSGSGYASSSASLTVVGEDAADQLGAGAAIVGDLNGDGYDDLAVGAPEDDHGQIDGGTVCLLYGRATQRTGAHYIDGCDARLVGTAYTQHAGATLSSAGDLDEDGQAELLVGAPLYTVEETYAGAVYIVPGDRYSGEHDLVDIAEPVVGANGSEAGTSLAPAGGGAFLVGAPEADGGAGTAYLVRGIYNE